MFVQSYRFAADFERFFVAVGWIIGLFFYFGVDMKVFLFGAISFRTSTDLSFVTDDGFVHLCVYSSGVSFIRLGCWNSISLFIRHHFIKIMRKC